MSGERLHETKYRRPKGEWAYRLFVVRDGERFAVMREEVDSRRKPVNYRTVATCVTVEEAIETAEIN